MKPTGIDEIRGGEPFRVNAGHLLSNRPFPSKCGEGFWWIDIDFAELSDDSGQLRIVDLPENDSARFFGELDGFL